MGLDQSGVLTVGTFVPEEDGHTLLQHTLLVIPPGVVSHRSSLAPQGLYIRAVPMQHMLNKAHTHWVAANLISGHLALTLVTIGRGLQGTARAGTVLRKQRMCRCLERRTRLRVGVSTFTITGALQEF